MYDKEFEIIGKRLFSEGLVTANFGNMSVREKGGFFITPSGSFLDESTKLVFVSDSGIPCPGASSEYRVHLETYKRTTAGALVHVHPPFAVAASFSFDEIVPQDTEGKMFCPLIPVVNGDAGSDELAQNVADALTRSPVVIARAHGTFAIGESLKECYILTSIVEHACKIIYYCGGFGGLRF